MTALVQQAPHGKAVTSANGASALFTVTMRGAKREWLVWVAATLLLLPIAADFAIWSIWRQRVQDYVDEAARSGATALREGGSVEAAALAELPLDRLPLAGPPLIDRPPRLGLHRGRPNAVQVRLPVARSSFFWSQLFGPSVTIVRATGAAMPTDRAGETRPVVIE